MNQPVPPSQESRYRMWSSLGIGLMVVAVGVVFLLDNFGWRLPFYRPHNWWALFILVGAIPLLAQAADRYRSNAKVDRTLLCLLLSAAAPIMVATMFLLDLDWGLWWPLFVIYGGLWVMVGGRKKDRPS
jgi:O-antigen/teichoic acid export membrane protein